MGRGADGLWAPREGSFKFLGDPSAAPRPLRAGRQPVGRFLIIKTQPDVYGLVLSVLSGGPRPPERRAEGAKGQDYAGGLTP